MSREVVTNVRTGEQVEFVSCTAEVLTMDVTWPHAGRRAAAHLHPGMEETWVVLDGRAAFEIDGVRIDAGPGTSVTAPAGRPHLAWNAGDAPVRLRIEMRPPRRWAEFTRRFFAGEDPVALLQEFADEVALAPRPGA